MNAAAARKYIRGRISLKCSLMMLLKKLTRKNSCISKISSNKIPVKPIVINLNSITCFFQRNNESTIA